MAIMQGGLVGPLVKRFGEKRLAVNSLLLQALAFTGTALSSSFVHIARKNAAGIQPGSRLNSGRVTRRSLGTNTACLA